MFTKTAKHYDVVYSDKDYPANHNFSHHLFANESPM